MAQSESNERKWIWLLCLLAAIHVFIFSAAFPLFNNVDEPMHFDLVLKYAERGLPRGLQPLSKESLRYIVLFSTSAYFENPTNLPDEKFPPPPWTQPMEQVRQTLLTEERTGSGLLNYEASQPPLYYQTAALWWRLGETCGIRDGFLPFWLRFLNIIFVAAILWIAYVIARFVFPENVFLRLGVPALIAFIPQTAFYSISNDILSPLCFGVLFYFVLRILKADAPDVRLGILAGLAIAITCFAKLTNLPLLAVSALVITGKFWCWLLGGKARETVLMATGFSLSAALSLIWFAWCKFHFGDWSGSEGKIEFLGWTHKPFAEWWHHPIFSPAGFWNFFSPLLATFWQGEFWWHGKPLAVSAVNTVYLVLSFCFAMAAVAALLLNPDSATASQCRALWLCLVNFAAAAAFLGFLSIIYDFHNCVCPSRAFPYFTAGRMILGALIPFAMVFLFGLDCLLNTVKAGAARFPALIAIILFMLISETVTDWPVFFSPYNWFHM